MRAAGRLSVWSTAALIAAAAATAAAQQPLAPVTGEIPELPPIEDLSVTVDRPLFMRSRRPPEPAAPAPVVAATPEKIPVEESPADLTGIVSGPDRTYAILTSHATKEVFHLRKGEKIEDWSVDEIGPRYVVLRRGSGSLRLELFDDKKLGSTGDRLANGHPLPPRQQRFTPRTRQYRPPPRRPRPTRRPTRRNADEDG